MRSRTAWRAAVGLVVLLTTLPLAGCHSAVQPAAGAGGTADRVRLPLTQVPAKQRSALTDGIVTRAEYEAAFTGFARCVAAGGGRLREIHRDRSTGLVTYGTGTALGTPDAPDRRRVEGRCYNDWFDRIEYVFQTTDPAVLAAAGQAHTSGEGFVTR
jgi:hypothetical protein